MKKLRGAILILAMIITILPIQIYARENPVIEAEGIEREAIPDRKIGVDDGIIDIDDKILYHKSSNFNASVTAIKVSGAEVKDAYQLTDSSMIYVILSWDTVDTAEITVEFQAILKNSELLNGTADIITQNGEGILDITVTGKRNNSNNSNYMGSTDYTLIFLREETPSTPPTRIAESDNKDIYKSTSITLKLSDYFKDAHRYYIADGDSKTLLEGSEYVFRANETGVHELVFTAENNIGQCPESVTVAINVTDIVSGIWIGHSTGNGSLDFVVFRDTDGNPIDDIEVSYESKTIIVTLPKSYPIDGKVSAEFSLTQNESGYPFLSTRTNSVGANPATKYKFISKEITLNAGSGNLVFYYFNSAPTGSNQETFTLIYKIENDLPVLSGGSSAKATIEAGKSYELDLTGLFADTDGDSLSYFVSINGTASVMAENNYVFSTDVAGTYTMVFTANDGKGTSAETYTVTLTVENSNIKNSMTVYLTEDLHPSFYISTEFEKGVDRLGDIIESVKGASDNGMAVYEISYPINAEMISIRTEDFGGMAFAVRNGGAVYFRKAQFNVTDYDNNATVSVNKVTYGTNTAVSGNRGWLLATEAEYIFTAVPSDTTLETAQKTVTLERSTDIYIADFVLGLNNPVSITIPTGAAAQLYKYNQYYDNTELDAKIVNDNGDGTTTYQFIADTKASGTSYIYRVTIDDKITKAGWLGWNEMNLTVTYTESDKAPSYRLDDYSSTGEENSTITEDSVLINVNSRNHLNLSVGQSKTLKAYRAWEIIPVSYSNYIIPPDFNFTILSGNDVVSLTEKDSPSACDGDWMTLTALKEGIAIIEVTYDAIDIRDSGTTVHYSGVYGASDPSRSGLLVVQVGENDDSSVRFGIKSFSGIGIPSTDNIIYNPSNQKEWDVEFDTLYFLGNSGKLTLKPTASSDINEVSVSNDKGSTWKTLNGDNGIYTAEIVSGNNIIRISTSLGTAYQVVRGDKITVKYDEVAEKSNDNGIIEAGETIRVTLVGLHSPIPKMAGNYNPGYYGNNDGYSSQHLNYTCNGTAIHGKGAQYNFVTSANHLEIVMPNDGSCVTLSNGYIGLGVIGLPSFVDGGDSHRNIPDSGCSTRGNQTTYHTRSILPEIVVHVGDTSAPNSAPIVRSDAVKVAEIYSDQNFAINPDTLFIDADSDTMTFTVSVNGEEPTNALPEYKFTPNATGTYRLLFAASDGKETAVHTITLTVINRPLQGGGNTEPDDKFGLSTSEISGYVTISFVDSGVRIKGESGLKYPKALGTIIKATKVPYIDGEKISHVTKRLLNSLGIRMEYTGTLENGFYLGAICNFELNGTPYNSMGEFDAGVGSGWMITLNKNFIEYGASEFTVKNGDIIKWQYTCQLGKDIGDPFYSGSTSSSSNKNSKSDSKKKDNKEETSNTEIQEKNTFVDIKKGDWHYEAVRYVYERGLMQGMGNGFMPDSKMSRAMLVTVLYRMANPKNAENTHVFADVPEDQWYYDAVAWATSNGIVKGISKTEFAPDSDISREQMALIIYRFAKLLDIDVNDVADISSFEDTDDISDWALDAIKWANKAELVNGTSETTLSPKATATRAQVAKVLMHFCEKTSK